MGVGEGALFVVGIFVLGGLITSLLERLTGSDRVEGLRGLGQRAPFAAAVFALSLLSLAGIPPLAGFAGKVLLLEVTLSGGLTWLAVVALINMAISLYYYLIPVAEMYLKAAPRPYVLPNHPGYLAALSLSLLGTLALGVVPAPALSLTRFVSQMLGN